ncbi:hypothetical protein Slin15195_G072940 [Septoria linicola]|uniref:Uncharacterized protein n=1 Tax=Septoria linicola TaxID=215465 RepID=A0A9Q9ARV9_9PEZI|nr:hypothetical protein Slin14017_G105660 [Septoria linicola]USW53975.1 hypothetical protein Slin15195_G072940 [Septoria linicola]
MASHSHLFKFQIRDPLPSGMTRDDKRQTPAYFWDLIHEISASAATLPGTPNGDRH